MMYKYTETEQRILEQINVFVSKLYHMVDFGDGIRWNDDGTQIVIADEEDFASRILPQVYGHSNFNSFIRQLNFYSFGKVMIQDPNTKRREAVVPTSFSHPNFIRNRIDKLPSVVRKTNVKAVAEQQKLLSVNSDKSKRHAVSSYGSNMLYDDYNNKSQAISSANSANGGFSTQKRRSLSSHKHLPEEGYNSNHVKSGAAQHPLPNGYTQESAYNTSTSQGLTSHKKTSSVSHPSSMSGSDSIENIQSTEPNLSQQSETYNYNHVSEPPNRKRRTVETAANFNLGPTRLLDPQAMYTPSQFPVNNNWALPINADVSIPPDNTPGFYGQRKYGVNHAYSTPFVISPRVTTTSTLASMMGFNNPLQQRVPTIQLNTDPLWGLYHNEPEMTNVIFSPTGEQSFRQSIMLSTAAHLPEPPRSDSALDLNSSFPSSFQRTHAERSMIYDGYNIGDSYRFIADDSFTAKDPFRRTPTNTNLSSSSFGSGAFGGSLQLFENVSESANDNPANTLGGIATTSVVQSSNHTHGLKSLDIDVLDPDMHGSII